MHVSQCVKSHLWTSAVSPVMIFVHQVVACSESHQPGVVRRRRDGDGASAADVSVAQLVGEELQLIGGETVVIPKDVVVGGTTGSLRTEHPPHVSTRLIRTSGKMALNTRKLS